MKQEQQNIKDFLQILNYLKVNKLQREFIRRVV